MKIKHFLMFVLAIMATSAFAQSMPQLTMDPATRKGKLPNGLTYYIRHNEWPEHMANFYIAQRVGSIQEEEEQRGLAHFLEHMAFNGSENFKKVGIIDWCREKGIQFGSDLNAYTGVDQTVYRVCNVPTGNIQVLDSCLLILKDWSNGLLLQDKEIDKERGVIHAEWSMRNNGQMRLLEQTLPTLYPNSRWGVRMPIGTMEVIDNFPYDVLRKYYKKWYRPDNQAIIVVGDVDVDRTEQKIKELFSSIVLQPNAAQVEKVPVADNNEPIYVVGKDKEINNNAISVFMKTEPFPMELKNTEAYYFQSYVNSLFASMIASRFAELAQKPECPYLSASSSIGDYLLSNTKAAVSLDVSPKEGKDLEALTDATKELMRVRQHGFTAGEFGRAKSDFISWVEKGYANRDKRENDRFGDACRDNYLTNEPLVDIETEYAIWNQIDKSVTLDMINDFVKQIISVSDTNLVVFEFAQDKEGRFVPTAEQLRKTFEAARAAQVEPWQDNVKNEPLITQMPKKGKIVKRSENKTLGFKELKLSNGATVILKKTDFKADEVSMTATADGGTALYGEKDFANIKLVNNLCGISALGNFTMNELNKALAGKNCSTGFSMSGSKTSIAGSTTPKDMETFLQLIYLQFTDVRKDMQSYGQLMTSLKQSLPNRGLKPESAFSDTLRAELNCHQLRSKPLELADLDKVSYDRCLQMAKERTANAANFTFFFVGNYDEATLLPLIEQYIASLPGKKADKVAKIDTRTYFKGQKKNAFTRKMETPRPQVGNIYYCPIENNLENSVIMEVAGEVVTMEMLNQVREEMSAAYSCGANISLSLMADKAYAMLSSQAPISEPSKLDAAAERMKKIVADAAKSVDPDKVKKVKDNMLKSADIAFKNNQFWMSALVNWKEYGIDIYTNYKKTIEGVTPAKVAAMIKRIVDGGNHLEIVMRPE